MKYAVADISSSSLSVIIAESDGSTTEITGKERESLSLLYYMDGKDLSRRGTEKLVTALSQMKSRLEEMGVEKCWLIATAALRHISNFEEVTDAVRERTGLVVNLIDGEAEAYCDYTANMCYSSCERAVLVDLGGKSMEICALGAGRDGMTCFDFGLLDLYEKFADKIQPDETEAEKMGKYVKSRFEKANLPGKDVYSTVILVGQTCGAIYDMYAEYADEEPGDGAKTMERKRFFKLAKKLAGGADRSRLILKTAPEKMHVILPAAVVIKKLLKRFGASNVIVSDRGVKEGYLTLVLDGKESGAHYDFTEGASFGEPRSAGKPDGKAEPVYRRSRTPVRRDKSEEMNLPGRGGRPGKSAEAAASAVKRGRGRPKKDGGTAAASAEKKKRGRPKKTRQPASE